MENVWVSGRVQETARQSARDGETEYKQWRESRTEFNRER